MQRGAQAVTHRHSVHRRVNVVRAGTNCEEEPICRLFFTVGLAIIDPCLSGLGPLEPGPDRRPDRDCPGAVVEEPQFSPGRSPGCGLWSRNPAGQPRTQTGPGNADWAASRFPVRSNWHYLPCENSDALRSICGVTWRLSRGRPGDDCVRGRRQLSRGAQAVTHRTAFTGV